MYASRPPVSTEFERVTTKLAKYASEKNLEGASLMYVQLTLNCVDCHRFVRDKGLQVKKQPAEKDGVQRVVQPEQPEHRLVAAVETQQRPAPEQFENRHEILRENHSGPAQENRP